MLTFRFNDYGAKVPLQEFRPTDPLSGVTDAPTKDVLNVFMEVKDEGYVCSTSKLERIFSNV